MTARAQREAVLRRERDAQAAVRPDLSTADVWALLKAGCNADEVAAYAQVSLPVARAMCAEAMHEARAA